jgi:hypothetical protein
MGTEAALALVATRRPTVYRQYTLDAGAPFPRGELIVNPLYRVDVHDGRSELTLTFPTPEYAEEFAAARRYLPDTVSVAADLSKGISPDAFGREYDDLKRRMVLLDAPTRYS